MTLHPSPDGRSLGIYHRRANGSLGFWPIVMAAIELLPVLTKAEVGTPGAAGALRPVPNTLPLVLLAGGAAVIAAGGLLFWALK